MTGTIKEYTPNFNFIIPEFNIAGWHDYINDNFKSIDALFYNIFDVQNYVGAWYRLTSYTEGQIVFISDTSNTNYLGKLYKVLVDHTTTDEDFDDFWSEHPTYYERYLDASSAQQYANFCKIYAEGTDEEVASIGITHSCKVWNQLIEQYLPYKGQYSATTTYNEGDIVWFSDKSSIYLCISNNITDISPANHTKWARISVTYTVYIRKTTNNATYNISLVNGNYTGDTYMGPVYYSPNVPKINAYTGEIVGYQKTSNLVTSIDNTSTDTQYPSAKCVYDIIGNIETLLSNI